MAKANHGTLDIGISTAERKAIASRLAPLLADTYILYLKTHNYHWNVTGPQFNDLDAMFMVQYTELWNSVDLIAERIRSLGHFAPGSHKSFAELSSIEEEAGVPTAAKMVGKLLDGHETVARTCRLAFPVAEKAGDQPTMDTADATDAGTRKDGVDARSMLGR